MTETLRLGTSGRRLDEVAVQQGIPKECPFRPGLNITILPAAPFNPRFRRAMQDYALRSSAKESTNGDLAASEKEAKVGILSHLDDPELVAHALVGDMDGLYNEKGNPVKYTPERGLKILSDPTNADVLQWIATQALQYGQFYTDEVEADAKNSRTGSGGKSKAGAGKSAKTKS